MAISSDTFAYSTMREYVRNAVLNVVNSYIWNSYLEESAAPAAGDWTRRRAWMQTCRILLASGSKVAWNWYWRAASGYPAAGNLSYPGTNPKLDAFNTAWANLTTAIAALDADDQPAAWNAAMLSLFARARTINDSLLSKVNWGQFT